MKQQAFNGAKSRDFTGALRRGRSRIGVVVLGSLVAVSAGLWFWAKRGPVQHEVPIAIEESSAPGFSADKPMQLLVGSPAPLVMAARYGARPQKSHWEVVGAKFRGTASEPWQEMGPPAYAKSFVGSGQPAAAITAWPLLLPVSGDLPVRYVQKLADKAGEWRFKVRLTRSFASENQREIWHGSAEHEVVYQHESAKSLDIAIGRPAPAPFIVPGRAYIAGLRWSFDYKEWHDLPQPGQANFPLVIHQFGHLQLRITRRDPSQKWPRNPSGGKAIKWGGIAAKDDRGREDIGLNLEEKDLKARRAGDVKTFTATCGNTVQGQILVLPMPQITQLSPKPLPGSAPGQLTLEVAAQVRWDDWHPPIKVRFLAFPMRIRPRSTPPATPQPAMASEPIAADAEGWAKTTLKVPNPTPMMHLRAVLGLPGAAKPYFSDQYVKVPTLQQNTELPPSVR